MGFKDKGIGFSDRSHFTNEMSRFVGDEVSCFSNNESGAGAVDDMAEKTMRMSYEKQKTSHGEIKAERKAVSESIKSQKIELKSDVESYTKDSQALLERKQVLENKIKSQSQTNLTDSQKQVFRAEIKEERANIKAQERFLDDKAARIEEKELKINQSQEKKKELRKKENREKKKQSARLNAASLLKAKKDISNELVGGGSNTGDAFRDGKTGLVGTVLEVINPMHYIKALLAKMAALLAPYLMIFATIAIIVVVIFAILFDFLSPIIEVSNAIHSFISFFTDDDTFVNSAFTDDEIDEIVEDSECDAEQEKVIRYALSKVGYPYSQAKRTSGNYYDCSSLAYYSWKAADVDISYGTNYPPTAAAGAQTLEGKGKALSTTEIASLKPGDLVYYGGDSNGRYQGIYHVAIYIGDGKAVEALNEQYGVVYQNLRTDKVAMVCRPNK